MKTYEIDYSYRQKGSIKIVAESQEEAALKSETCITNNIADYEELDLEVVAVEEAKEHSNDRQAKCRCGFEADTVAYRGGSTGLWFIRCSSSKCPATFQSTSREKTVAGWNELQEHIC